MHAPLQAVGPAARTVRAHGRVLGRCTVGAIRVMHGRSGFSDRPCTMHSYGQRAVRGWGPDRPCATRIGRSGCSDRPLQLTVRTNIGSVNQPSGWLTGGPKPWTVS